MGEVLDRQDTYKGNPWQPWTQNLYVYVGNNPVNYVDPTGHDAEEPAAETLPEEEFSFVRDVLAEWAKETAIEIGKAAAACFAQACKAGARTLGAPVMDKGWWTTKILQFGSGYALGVSVYDKKLANAAPGGRLARNLDGQRAIWGLSFAIAETGVLSVPELAGQGVSFGEAFKAEFKRCMAEKREEAIDALERKRKDKTGET